MTIHCGTDSLASMTEQPQRVNAGPHAVSYSLNIQAPAADIYALVANPHLHHQIDGSSTVGSRAIGPSELTEGASFSVHMKKFGLPYRLPLRVTEARPPAPSPSGKEGTESGVVEWRQPTGHRWRWEITPQSASTSLVTETYDAAGQNPAVRAALNTLRVPQANASSIRASLLRLASHYDPVQ